LAADYLQLQLFIEHAPAAVAMFDRDMRYLAASPRWLRDHRLGMEVLGRSHYDVLPDIPERWKEVHRRALAGEVIAKEDDRFDRADGTVQWLNWEVRPWHASDGQVGGIVISLEEITDRKRSDEALRASETRFRAIFENAATGIAITDWEGRFFRCNPAYCKLVGYTEEELGQIKILDLIHPDDRADNLAIIRSLRDKELPSFEIENRYVRNDGEAVWVRKFVSLLHDQEGQPPHILALVTDVTDRRRMEAALLEADRRKDEFLATLAHELRNPLAPIRNALLVFKRSGADTPNAENLLSIMERQLDHLVRLVDDLLEVSRISRGKIELKKERCDLAGILHHAVETAQPHIQAAAQRLTVELPSSPVTLDADPVRLAQVFANVLNNASKYTENGGRIWLKAERSGDEVIVSVRDNGMGISAEMLTSVFELFFQTSRTLGRAQGGLGIGLALARSLVHLHGGQIEARSEGPGRGSEFSVRLPLFEAPSGHAESERNTAVAPELPRRILVVDDDRDVADSFVMLLRCLGMDVRVAYGGAAALAAVAEFKPRLAFVDIGMPGMDGYETARQIRRVPAGQDLILVALSGWDRDDDRRRSAEAGFDHHFVKPIEVDGLEKLLASTPVGA